MEKYGFVYIWRDKKYKRYYVGCHWGTEEDSYICSSKWMKKSYKRRPQDFKRRILSRVYTNKKDMFEKEYQWLLLIKDNELKIRYYNSIKGWMHWSGNPEKEVEVKKTISQKTKEAMQRPEVREKYLEGLKTRDCRSYDLEVREKRRQSMIKTMKEKYPDRQEKKKMTKEERTQYYSDKAKKIWSNPGHKELVGIKISQGLQGKRNRLGHTNSEEHRRKISEAQRGKTQKRHRISIEGVLFESCIKASEVLGLSSSTINRRVKSERFPEYRRVLE
jgi:hypothetical protein